PGLEVIVNEVGRLRPGRVLTQRYLTADRADLELDEPRLALCIGSGKGVHAPIGRTGKAPPQRQCGKIVGLMQRFGIGGGERHDLRYVRLAIRSGTTRLQERQYLVERPCKMH